jgi:Uma2 family endonuclease
MSTAILAEAERETKPSSPALPMGTDEALYELINGRWVELPQLSIRAMTVVGRLCAPLYAYAASSRLGEPFAGMLIRMPMPEDKGRIRRLDVCFISATNQTAASPEDPDAIAWDVVPDLAVEVTSPTDRAEDQREKVQEYLQLGVRCVWVVYPTLRVIDVYEASGLTRTFGPHGVLPGDPVLPGLEIPLDELFRPIGPAAE